MAREGLSETVGKEPAQFLEEYPRWRKKWEHWEDEEKDHEIQKEREKWFHSEGDGWQDLSDESGCSVQVSCGQEEEKQEASWEALAVFWGSGEEGLRMTPHFW